MFVYILLLLIFFCLNSNCVCVLHVYLGGRFGWYIVGVVVVCFCILFNVYSLRSISHCGFCACAFFIRALFCLLFPVNVDVYINFNCMSMLHFCFSVFYVRSNGCVLSIICVFSLDHSDGRLFYFFSHISYKFNRVRIWFHVVSSV